MPTPLNLLGYAALDVVIDRFRAALTTTLDEKHVDFTLQSTAATLTITAREVSTDGQVGIYDGAATYAYGKANLNALLPYPLLYQGAWPTTYRELTTYMQSTYGILLEAQDFHLPGNSVTTALGPDDPLDATPDEQTGEVALTATAISGRWLLDSSLRLIVTPPNGPVRVKALIDTPTTASVQLLTDSAGAIDPFAP